MGDTIVMCDLSAMDSVHCMLVEYTKAAHLIKQDLEVVGLIKSMILDSFQRPEARSCATEKKMMIWGIPYLAHPCRPGVLLGWWRLCELGFA
jgi:hypothetical protein